MNQDKKVAIVTGASKGIGKAIAINLLEQNYFVVGVYNSSESLALEIEKQYPDILMIKGDVGNNEDAKRVIETTFDKYGKIDVLVNNAGVDCGNTIENYKVEDWDRLFNTNIKSIFLFSKYSIPYLKNSENPVIINISSRLGFPEFSENKYIVYGTTKAAVTYFTQALAKELEDTKIRVNAVIPTVTKTDMFDQAFSKEDEEMFKNKGKLGKIEDVVNAVMKLINDHSVTGKIQIDERIYL